MNVARTERLVLRRYEDADGETLLLQLNDPSFLRFVGDRGVRTLEDARRYLTDRIKASYERHGFGMYLVELEDGTPIGMAGLVRREGLEDADIGFAFLPEYRGLGYAREAAGAVLDLARDRFEMRRILAITSVDNEASARLLDRLGFAPRRMVELPGEGVELQLWAWSSDPAIRSRLL